MTRAFKSLKFRLMFLITLVLILVVGVPVAVFIYHLDKNYREFSTNMLEATTGMAYQGIFNGLMHNDKAAIQEKIEQMALESRVSLLRIYNTEGTIVYSSNPDEIQHDIRDFESRTLEDYQELESFEKVDNHFVHHHPIYVQEECAACHDDRGSVIGVIDLHSGFIDSQQIYASSKKLSIIGAVLIIVILWIVTNFLYQSQIESKLLTINNGFDRLAKGDFGHKIKMTGQHELAMLADRFNQTVEKLQEAKDKEEILYQDKLERADRLVTLGEVAAEIAHEVNNPAGIILTRAEYLKEELQDKGVNGQCIEDLEIIAQQTKKIAGITRSILHYGRKLPYSFHSTDLNDVILHSINVLQPRISMLRTKIQLDESNNAAKVWGNFSQLEQVFCNLINNSLDAVPPNAGFISIKVLASQNSTEKPIHRIIYRDNGPGIPQESTERIFTPFYTTKEDGKGTGLGLFIARNIINNHNGKLLLDQDLEEGACFILEMEGYNE